MTRLKGLNKLESIHFKNEEDTKPEKLFSKEGITELFIKPDVVIAENGIGQPKLDLKQLIDQKEDGSLSRIGIDRQNGIPASNIRFSLLYNDIQSPIYAAGSCT